MKLFRLTAALSVLLMSVPSYARYSNPALKDSDAQRNAVYEWVYNSDNVAHEVGDVVVYKDGTYDGVEVSTTTTAANPLVAGVVVGNTIAATSWGNIQVAGYCPTVTIGVANAAGDPLVTSTTGEAAGVLDIATATTTVSAQSAVFAVAFEATTTSTTVKAILLGR